MMSDMADLQAQIDELRALLAERTDPPREIVTAWGERTCQVCGELADVIDVQRPPGSPARAWNGEGYCAAHADELGITAEDHPHLIRPGPKRRKP
jgi:hypothetical protein